MSNELVKIKDMLEMIDVKINHIEDIISDNRDIIIKLVKQGNTIVQFLRDLDSDLQDLEHNESLPTPTIFMKDSKELDRIAKVQEILDEYVKKNQDLKEFEEELKKHKDEITPGQLGES